MVIAGKAAAGAFVEIMTGSHKIGSATASENGDFVVVLDEPLKPGDYQIVSRATEKSGASATSQETAVVSVPDTPAGQVLALVEQPGEASRLITVPEGQTTAGQETDVGKSQDGATSGQQPEEDGQAAAEPPAAATSVEQSTGQDVAAAEPAAKPEATQPPAAGEKPAVAVAAVEIEGRHVFVAGTADPGRMVRVYANEILLGQARASEGGRFLVEAERDLPVGDYIIRADALGLDGAKVVARAAVPFEREPGETIAAVAPSAPAPEAAQARAVGAKPAVAAAQPAADTADETSQGNAASTGSAAENKQSPSEQVSEPATPAPAPAEPSADAAAAQNAPAAEGAEQAADKPAAAQQGGTSEEAAASASAEPSAPAAEPSAQAAAGEGAQAVLSPKLKSVDNAVIIRRGDTLWRISRRAYGHGVRFSTIYLANRDQIENPDKIWPGQVFAMPEKTEQGEAADWGALGDQITTRPPASTAN
ncbi:MAG: LysM peptidoglycan-binding domain-containing protein [Rhizobiaceae bacterium]|nr:LysM peptidoglycan-binding domain-containing protein [Rhizobiaceae bacterium]